MSHLLVEGLLQKKPYTNQYYIIILIIADRNSAGSSDHRSMTNLKSGSFSRVENKPEISCLSLERKILRF